MMSFQNETISPEEEKEEREIIGSLDPYVIIEYIKSSVDIILNLKFEEIEKRLIEKTDNPNDVNQSSAQEVNTFAKKRKNLSHGQNKDILNDEPQIASQEEVLASERSSYSNTQGPPKIYEELIQSLEADIRKHIRVSLIQAILDH